MAPLDRHVRRLAARHRALADGLYDRGHYVSDAGALRGGALRERRICRIRLGMELTEVFHPFDFFARAMTIEVPITRAEVMPATASRLTPRMTMCWSSSSWLSSTRIFRLPVLTV